MTDLVEGKRNHGRPRVSWIDNILMWTGLTGIEVINAVCDGRSWAMLVHLCLSRVQLLFKRRTTFSNPACI